MSPDGTKPPPFYCPACGKKHRADLSGLTSHEGAHAKVTCHRCGVEMTLFLGSDGLPKCEARTAPADAPGSETPPSAAVTAPAQPTASGGTMPKSNLLVHLVASAVVAGVVSFLVLTLGAKEPSDADADGRIEKLEGLLRQARMEISELSRKASAPQPAADVEGIKRSVQAEIEALRKTVNANGDGIGNLTEIFQKANATFTKLGEDYKALNGRIEANYQKGRALDKRLKALEGK